MVQLLLLHWKEPYVGVFANDASEVRQCWISSSCLDTMLLTVRLPLFKCPFL